MAALDRLEGAGLRLSQGIATFLEARLHARARRRRREDLWPLVARELAFLEQVGPGRIVVIGNGPSISRDLETIRRVQQGSTIITVNDSIGTNLFNELRPRLHVVADPSYWNPNAGATTADPIAKSLRCLNDDIDWDLHILLPLAAKSWNHFQKHTNPLVHLHYYSTAPVRDICSEQERFHFYTQRLCMPPVQNVMIASLIIALWTPATTVLVFGVDHSFHQNVVVGVDNRLYWKNAHYYDEAEIAATPLYMDPEETTLFTVSEFFSGIGVTFRTYQEVRKYADSLGKKVVNLTPGSFIDAFVRSEEP